MAAGSWRRGRTRSFSARAVSMLGLPSCSSREKRHSRCRPNIQSGYALSVSDGAPQPSAVRQLELDAAVSAHGLFVSPLLKRLEFAITGRDEPVGGHATRNQITYHRDRARCRQLPVGGELIAADGPAIGVPIHLQSPVDLRRYRAFEFENSRCKLVDRS